MAAAPSKQIIDIKDFLENLEGRMDEEKLNQFLDFIEEDTKLFSYQRDFIRTVFLKSNKDPHEVLLLTARFGRPPMKEFDAARILDGNPKLMNFLENLENPESPKS